MDFKSCHGPGYPTPLDAMKSQPELLAYVTCISPDWKSSGKADFLATVDLNPKSSTYSQVIHKLKVPYVGDELHHTGWNACSSCKDSTVKRNRFIMPGLNSGRIYIVDVSKSHAPQIYKIIEPFELHNKVNASAPHTVHCLPNGDVMISCLGDASGDPKGSFILLDQDTFELKGTWSKNLLKYNYDYWYQPRHNIMVSTEWAAPNIFRKGFFIEDCEKGHYGHSITFWDWNKKQPMNTIDLSDDGQIPLEVRFLHNPDAKEGFVGCALSSTVFRIFRNMDNIWDVEKVISVMPIRVKNWLMDSMPGLITDILISLDDRYLYISNFIQGDVRQYDISNTRCPRLTGQIFLGGCICQDSPVISEDNSIAPLSRPVVKGTQLRGGPQMLQLSLDGKRLYVTNSLHSAWDAQFYPDLVKSGSQMVLINIDIDNGGFTLDPNFLVDFSLVNDGPALAHEMRFPGGDCTSDIWV